MKTSHTFLVISCLSLACWIGCKKTTKRSETSTSSAATTKQYTVDPYRTEIQWTAYKTTDKIPVDGKFTQINLKNPKGGATVLEALNGTEFSIPVSSLFTDNEVRDYKLKTLFFGVMKNTIRLSGKIHLTDEQNGYIDFSMNAVVEKLPFTFTTAGNETTLTAIMNTDSWQAQKAIASINEACYELHKGPDGVSKTWSDVAIRSKIRYKLK